MEERTKYSAQIKYDSKNTVRYAIKLNKSTDAEIIKLLESAKSKQGLIKSALQEYAENHL